MKTKLTHTFINVVMKSAAAVSGVLAPLLVDRSKISILKNIPYGSHSDQILDVYIPSTKKTTLPISILIHGGGFSFFSKDSHARAASMLASSDRIVFCINYRLTPKHPFPAGLSDTIKAYSWIIQNAKKYGGDLEHISVTGESAGGNFALGLCLYLYGVSALHTDAPLPEIPHNKPKHAVIHCGHLHVSNVDRYIQNKDLHPLVLSRILQIQQDYLPLFRQIAFNEAGLADPLVELEKLAQNNQPLPEDFPQIFIPVGDRDPVIGDSIRLAQVLEKLGQKNRLKVYTNEGHAFYVMPFRKKFKDCWEDIFSFLNS